MPSYPSHSAMASQPPKSKEEALLSLMERTGYNIVQENGQRKYGPPPNWEGPLPPKGSEVFVGKIPRDLYEDELVPVFEKVGKIYEVRLMMDFSGSNRGYAFIMFANSNDAKKACAQLDNFEIRKGRFIGVCKSVDNCRLFVGGIPKTKTKEEIYSEMKKVTEGVVDVILYSSVADKSKNRGFAFVEYENHRAAAMARRKLIPGKIQLWGHEIAVDWAEPEADIDEKIMAQVTVLYVRNLMLSTSEEKLKDVFSLKGTLKVDKVKKLRDFAFVHYSTREAAEQALNAINDTIIDGVCVEVTWAKPVDRSTKAKQQARQEQVGLQPALGHSSYMAVYEPYAYAPSNFMLSTTPTTTLVPPPAAATVTPSSSTIIRASQRGRGRGAAGMRGARFLSTSASSAFGRPLGSCRKSFEPRFIEYHPSMELMLTNPYTLKPIQLPSQVLHDACQKNNWGEPIFQLHSMNEPSTGSDQHSQMFLYKVTIPGLVNQYNTFMPDKLFPTPEEAKNYAAEFVLNELRIPFESIDVCGTTNHHHSSGTILGAPMLGPPYGRPFSFLAPPGYESFYEQFGPPPPMPLY